MVFNEVLSYKQLCSELGDKELRGGTQRNKQFNRWLKRYEIEKAGKGKYIVLRQLSDEEVQKIDDKNNYSQYLQHLLLKLFANQEEVSHAYTYRDLREQLAMVNRHYFPVKYGKENLTIMTSAIVNLGTGEFEADDSAFVDEENWFMIADNHDKDVLKYAIQTLNNKGLITMFPTYYFYKNERIDAHTTISTKHLATKEERAELEQIKLDMVQEQKKKGFNEIYRDEKLLRQYHVRVNKFLMGLGYESYAKAYVIDRPANLKGVADYFAPKFNSMQVLRYLSTKRFKEIPDDLHKQLTEQLIKN